jgi:hypothetical protein
MSERAGVDVDGLMSEWNVGSAGEQMYELVEE